MHYVLRFSPSEIGLRSAAIQILVPTLRTAQAKLEGPAHTMRHGIHENVHKTCVASKHCFRNYGAACAPKNRSRIASSDFPRQKYSAAHLPRLRYSDFWPPGPMKRGVLSAVPNRLLRFSPSEIPGRLPPRTPLLRFWPNFRTQMWPGGPLVDQSR